LNQAYGRVRIIAATLTIFVMLQVADLAMEEGRRARDGACLAKGRAGGGARAEPSPAPV
jgi:hypothetical protein